MALSKIDFRDTKTRTALLILLVGVAGGFGIHRMYIVDLRQQVQTLESTHSRKVSELNEIRLLKPQMERLRKEVAFLDQELDSLRKKFPDQKEIPRLIRDITKVAKASGIYTKKFNPLPDVVREYYVENRYAISVTGGYHELANFFSFLANLPLIINLSNVRINTNPGVEQSKNLFKAHGGSIETIIATFEMTTFSSKPM
jgi:type IV pilus assembly protein PilO